MVGNATQQSKKEKKAKEQQNIEAQQDEREHQEKRSSNPQTPKQVKQIDLDKKVNDTAKSPNGANGASDLNAYSPSQYNSTGKKSRYKGKGYDAQGRPRNFYNPPGKVMRHLAQQSYYDNFYGNQGQFNTLKQKYKTQLCKHWLEQSKCPLAQYCQFAHGEDDLRQPNDVSSVIELSYLILFFFSATSKELRQDCSRCSALQLQDDPMQVLVRDRSMQVR